jgi:DNA-binding Lrp family transcriptional regulator
LCCPSLETLAKNLCCDERSVRRALTALEEAGIIQREERFIDGRQTTTNYRFVQKVSGREDASVPPGGDASVPQNQEVDNRKTSSSKKTQSSKRGEDISRPVPDIPSGKEEVREYIAKIKAKGLVWADEFIDYYEAANPPWHRNGKPIRSWRQTLQTWVRFAREREEKSGKPLFGQEEAWK